MLIRRFAQLASYAICDGRDYGGERQWLKPRLKVAARRHRTRLRGSGFGVCAMDLRRQVLWRLQLSSGAISIAGSCLYRWLLPLSQDGRRMTGSIARFTFPAFMLH